MFKDRTTFLKNDIAKNDGCDVIFLKKWQSGCLVHKFPLDGLFCKKRESFCTKVTKILYMKRKKRGKTIGIEY